MTLNQMQVYSKEKIDEMLGTVGSGDWDGPYLLSELGDYIDTENSCFTKDVLVIRTDGSRDYDFKVIPKNMSMSTFIFFIGTRSQPYQMSIDVIRWSHWMDTTASAYTITSYYPSEITAGSDTFRVNIEYTTNGYPWLSANRSIVKTNSSYFKFYIR